MNRNCCSRFPLCINGSSMGCFVPFCMLCPLNPKLELDWEAVETLHKEEGHFCCSLS